MTRRPEIRALSPLSLFPLGVSSRVLSPSQWLVPKYPVSSPLWVSPRASQRVLSPLPVSCILLLPPCVRWACMFTIYISLSYIRYRCTQLHQTLMTMPLVLHNCNPIALIRLRGDSSSIPIVS